MAPSSEDRPIILMARVPGAAMILTAAEGAARHPAPYAEGALPLGQALRVLVCRMGAAGHLRQLAAGLRDGKAWDGTMLLTPPPCRPWVAGVRAIAKRATERVCCGGQGSRQSRSTCSSRGQMKRTSRHTAIPGPQSYSPLGIFPRLRRDPLRYLSEAARRYGEVVSLPLGARQAYLLAHPAHIQYVLQDQADRYRKDASVARIRPLFGDGLTTSEGALWHRQRHLMQPLFQWQRLLPWTDVIAEPAATLLAHWESFAARGQPIELMAALRDLTQGIMRQVLFGPDPRLDAEIAGHALTTAVRQLDRRIWAMLPAPPWLPTRRNRQLRQALHPLNAYVYRCIAEHRHPGSAADDLLARLLAACDDATSERMPARQLRDEVVTLWVAARRLKTSPACAMRAWSSKRACASTRPRG
jgi:hypothetical protein